MNIDPNIALGQVKQHIAQRSSCERVRKLYALSDVRRVERYLDTYKDLEGYSLRTLELGDEFIPTQSVNPTPFLMSVCEGSVSPPLAFIGSARFVKTKGEE